MTGWEISPFEPGGLRVAPLRPPVLPEPARHGERIGWIATRAAAGTRGSGSTIAGGWAVSRESACRWCLCCIRVITTTPRTCPMSWQRDSGCWPRTSSVRKRGAAAHLPGACLPHRRWRAPACLVLRPARGTGPAVRVMAGCLGRPAAGVPGRCGRGGRCERGRRAGRLVRRSPLSQQL